MLSLILYVILLFVNTFILIPGFLAIVFISWVVSLGVRAIARLTRARVTQRFDDYGAIWAGDDLSKRPYTNVVVHLIFKGTITIDQLRSQFQTKLLSWHGDPEKRRKFWRLKQRWTTFLGYLFWEPIPGFDLTQHVRLYDFAKPELRLPSVVTEEDLNRISSAYLAHPSPKACPWELLLIPSYYVNVKSDDNEKDGSRQEQHCAILFKVHHALLDGTGMNDLFLCLFDNKHEENAIRKLNKFPVRTPLQKLVRTLSICIRIPFDFSSVGLAIIKGQNEWISLAKTLPQEYHTYFSDAIPLKSVKEIAKHYKVSVTATVHSLITGAIVRMMKDNGQRIGDCMAFLCAYPLAGHPGGLTNHFTTQFFHFNPKLNAPGKSRLKAIGSIVQSIDVTNSIFPTYYAWLNKSWALLPARLVACWYLFCSFTAILTFLPGPPDGSEFHGKAQLVDIILAAGFPAASCGCSCVALSYNGKLRFGLNVDRHNLPKGPGSADRFSVYLNEGLAELLK